MRTAVQASAVWTEGTEPDVSFVPPLLRRRCSRLTRMMLHVAWRAGQAHDVAAVPAIFASRHGEVVTTLDLLAILARRGPLTATAFSHSVHNAPVGLFSIATGNRRAASAVAAGPDTFGAAFLEAVASMHRSCHDRALLVVADDAVPDLLLRFVDPPPPAHAVALLLGPGGVPIAFEPGSPTPARVPRTPKPDALRFVEWLEGAAPALSLGARTTYTWRRLDTPDEGGTHP
jgi:hypothetical protein